jgi:hypothetical protein
MPKNNCNSCYENDSSDDNSSDCSNHHREKKYSNCSRKHEHYCSKCHPKIEYKKCNHNSNCNKCHHKSKKEKKYSNLCIETKEKDCYKPNCQDGKVILITIS